MLDDSRLRIARAGFADADVRIPPGGLGVRALHHTAIAVWRMAEALVLYRDLLGGTIVYRGGRADEGFRSCVIRYANGSQVELLEPDCDGFLKRFLQRRGEGVHHLTFLVADLQHAVETARSLGLRVVDESYVRPDWHEAFIAPASAHGTIVQLAEVPAHAEVAARATPVSRVWTGDTGRT